MDELTAALSGGDTAAFLGACSRSTPLHILDTRAEGQPDAQLAYADLAESLTKHDMLYEKLFGASDKSLRSYVIGQHAKPWKALGPYQFAPPAAALGKVWIAWHPEGARWVVDTIAWPLL
jgi:hypothetical protein